MYIVVSATQRLIRHDFTAYDMFEIIRQNHIMFIIMFKKNYEYLTYKLFYLSFGISVNVVIIIHYPYLDLSWEMYVLNK